MNIIKHNLKLMESTKEGGMRYLLKGESHGGNAGTFTYKGHVLSCAAANFAYEKETGKIIIFTNKPTPKLAEGTFIIADSLELIKKIEKVKRIAELKIEKVKKTKSPIVESFLEKGTTTEAKNIIIASILEYNEESKKIFKDIKIRIRETKPFQPGDWI